jgi:hypothetical protein
MYVYIRGLSFLVYGRSTTLVRECNKIRETETQKVCKRKKNKGGDFDPKDLH